MTTVVAVAQDGIVVMGADRATNVYDRPVIGVTKIRRITPRHGDRFLIGYAGDGALPAVLERHLTVDDTPDIDAPHDPWASAIAEAISDIAMDRHITENGRLDGSLILACHGRLWTVSHMQAIRHLDGVAAIGSGEGPAIGAVDAALELGHTDIEAIVTLAVAIGCTRDRYSAGAPQVETLPL